MVIPGLRVFITGGALRVGAAIARAFAGRGAKLTLHCNRSKQEASQLIGEFGGPEAGHRVVSCDLADPDSPEQLSALLREADVLINNASTYVRHTLAEESRAEADRQFAVNYSAPVELMKRFARERVRPGVIVNLLDQGIRHPDAFSFSYAISKKALAAGEKSARFGYIFKTLAALCDVFPRLNNFRARAVINTGCFIFTVLVAVSRIVNCAHFLSDVLAGGYITYLIFVLTRWLFFRNGKYEFTFKEKTAALADGSAEGGEEVENTSAQNGADNGGADADCGKPREKGEE